MDDIRRAACKIVDDELVDDDVVVVRAARLAADITEYKVFAIIAETPGRIMRMQRRALTRLEGQKKLHKVACKNTRGLS